MRVFGWDEAMADGGAALQAFLTSWAKESEPRKEAKTFSAFTVGDFDGCHLGHAALFKKVVAASKKSLIEAGKAEGEFPLLAPGAVTFRRGASSPKKTGGPAPCVSTLRQRFDAMEKSGLAFVLLIDFSYNFSKMEGSDFLKTLSENALMRYLSVGEDFRFGFKLGAGQREIAQAAGLLGFSFEPLAQVLLGGRRVSSTEIRKAVLRADFAAAQKLMGRPFALDIADVAFQPLDKESGRRPALCAPLEAFAQVLPPAGRYTAVLSGKRTETVECVCELDGQSLFIECENELLFRRGRIEAEKMSGAFFDSLAFIARLSF